MFTGLIEHLGEVGGLNAVAGGSRLSVSPTPPINDLEIGESIAVDGVCLTVEPESASENLIFFLTEETLSKTTIGKFGNGQKVNLERAMAGMDRFGGHLVMGHVDGVGKIARLDRQGEGWLLEVECTPDFMAFVAPKGSVAVDGISLTPVDVTKTSFTVALIPHTQTHTSLSGKGAGAAVNIEADMIARYVHQYMARLGEAGGVDDALLKRAGFQ